MAAIATVSWRLPKFIPTITRFRSPTGRPCSRRRRPSKAALRPRKPPRTRPPAAAGVADDEDDEIDTTPRDDDGPTVALEPADLVHEVSEPAETIEVEMDKLDVDRSAHEEDEDDDHAETVGQPVAVKEGNGAAPAPALLPAH